MNIERRWLGRENGSPAEFYASATIGMDHDGAPTVSAEPGAPSGTEEYYVLVLRDYLLGHYFHCLEMLLAAFAVQESVLGNAKMTHLVLCEQRWNNKKQNDVQERLLTAVFGNVNVITGRLSTPLVMSNVLFLDRKGSRTVINKFLEPLLPICRLHSRKFRTLVYKAASVPPAPSGCSEKKSRALYVKRNPPRYLLPSVEEALISIISEFIELQIVDFSSLTWREQVTISASSAAIFSVHGNGLTNICWLARGCPVLEIFPENAHHYDYQVLAEIFGLTYFGVERGNIFREFCRFGGAYGQKIETNKPIVRLDWPSIRLCLEAMKISELHK